MNRITIASTSQAFEQRVRRAFGESLNGELTRWGGELSGVGPGEGLERIVIDLTSGDPYLVALGPDVPLEAALSLAERVDLDYPDVSVVLVAEPTPDLWESAMRAGIRDVVATDASDTELRTAFERALATTERRRIASGGATDHATTHGTVVSILAPKGGSGKTAVATNLGAALAERSSGSVVIVDFDLQFGDVTNALGLQPEQTIYDVSVLPGKIDAMALKIALTPITEKLFVLCAPNGPGEGDDIPEARLIEILRTLSREFEYVVVDTAAGVTEQTLAAVEQSTDLVFVCDLSVAALRSMRKLVDAFDRLEFTDASRHFLLNRADSRVGVDIDTAASTAGVSVDIKLPSTRSIPLSMNEGTPLVMTSPRAPFARRMFELAGRLGDEPDSSSGLLRWVVAK